MSRWKPAAIALTLFLAAGTAVAEPPAVRPQTSPNPQPLINPYLNLLNRGNPAINYYGIVRPQIQQTQQLQMLQYGLAQTTEEATAALTQPTTATPGAPPDTGHAAGFMTYTKYFNTINPRGR